MTTSKVRHLPFGSSTAVDTDVERLGRVLGGVSRGSWRVVQIARFRLVLLWPVRTKLAEVHNIRERRAR